MVDHKRYKLLITQTLRLSSGSIHAEIVMLCSLTDTTSVNYSTSTLPAGGSICVLKVSVGDVEGLIPMFVLAPEILERHQELVGEQKLALSSYRTSDMG